MVFSEIFGGDMLIVLAVVALLFGGAKLPQLARALGSARGEFERGVNESGAVDSVAAVEGPDQSDETPAATAERRAAVAEIEATRVRAEADALKAELRPIDGRSPAASE